MQRINAKVSNDIPLTHEDGLSPMPPLHLPLGRGGRGRRGGRGGSRSLPLVPLLVVDAPVLSSDMFQQSNMTVSLL